MIIMIDGINFIKDLQKSLAEKNKENSQRLLEQWQNKPLELIEDFKSFIQLNIKLYNLQILDHPSQDGDVSGDPY